MNGRLEAEVYRFEVGPGERRSRLDLYLNGVFKGRSRSYWRKMVERGAVLLRTRETANVPPAPSSGDERTVKASSRVGPGDAISIVLGRLGRKIIIPDARESYTVLYEDQHLLAVNKRAGAFCHPVGRLHNRSLISDLKADRGDSGDEIRPCHRLDRFVSGLLLLVKTREAAAHLGAQFEWRQVRKSYLALVHGEIEGDSGEISLPVDRATDSVIRIRMGVSDSGRPAVTRYTVMRRYSGYTLLLLEPKTGRRHQLRLHLSEIGHPIVNDPLYGAEIDVEYFERQTFDNHDDPDDSRRWIALHSFRLGFDHPGTGVRTVLEAPPWGDFGELLDNMDRSIDPTAVGS